MGLIVTGFRKWQSSSLPSGRDLLEAYLKDGDHSRIVLKFLIFVKYFINTSRLKILHRTFGLFFKTCRFQTATLIALHGLDARMLENDSRGESKKQDFDDYIKKYTNLLDDHQLWCEVKREFIDPFRQRKS